jgi:ABC-type transport system substrate-binding protein
MQSVHPGEGASVTDLRNRPASRRRFLMSAAALAGSAAIASCAPAGPTTAPAGPTTAPAAPPKPTEPAKPSATAKPAAAEPTKPTVAATPPEVAKPAEAPTGLKSVARNRTLMTALQGREGKFVEAELWNVYAIGASTSLMNQLIFEPLAYYSVFADKEILWLAESYEYTKDFKELTIKLRAGINWSDGKPFTADDVVYTLSTLKGLGGKVRWSAEVSQYVDAVQAVDPKTVRVTFKAAAPRFFDFLSYKYDIGLQIVPKHVFDGQDWANFKNFDPAKGWPLSTGPWQIVYTGPEQKVADRRASWWGVAAGVGELPKMERVILVPFVGEQQTAQALISNQLDYTYVSSPQPGRPSSAATRRSSRTAARNRPTATRIGGRCRCGSTTSARHSTIRTSAGRSAT